jgi:hypothetical protein
MKTHFWITASLFHSATCSVFDAQTFAKAFKTTNNAEDGQHPNHHRRLEGIGDFPCYRNLQESYTLANDLETQAAAIPNLNVEVIDIGDSYEKTVNPAQGHDLIVVKITGDGVANAGKSTDKGVFFAQGTQVRLLFVYFGTLCPNECISFAQGGFMPGSTRRPICS